MVVVDGGEAVPTTVDTSKCDTKTLCLNVTATNHTVEEPTNWDGDKVNVGPWYDQQLFKVGDFGFTVGDATESVAGLMAVGAMITVICMCMAYRKKEKILKNARIASETVQRGSVSLRRSISHHSSELG